MEREIERAAQRARQYWYDDGLAEIATGCIFVLICLLFLAEGRSIIPSGASSVGLVVIVTAGFLLARVLVARAKARITYPRTGFVRYPRAPRRSRGLAGGVAGFMAALVAMLFAKTPASLAWIPALDGLLIGSFLLYLGYSLGIVRFFALAVLSAVLGVAVSLSGTGDILGSGVYFGVTGAATMVSGAITLATYLRGAGAPEDE